MEPCMSAGTFDRYLENTEEPWKAHAQGSVLLPAELPCTDF